MSGSKKSVIFGRIKTGWGMEWSKLTFVLLLVKTNKKNSEWCVMRSRYQIQFCFYVPTINQLKRKLRQLYITIASPKIKYIKIYLTKGLEDLDTG